MTRPTDTEMVLVEFLIPVSLYSIVEDMADEIVRLRRALAACERDSERLNWLGKQIDGVHVEAGLAGGEYQMRRFATVFTFTSEFRAETVRDAIDKAMNRTAVATAQGEAV